MIICMPSTSLILSVAGVHVQLPSASASSSFPSSTSESSDELADRLQLWQAECTHKTSTDGMETGEDSGGRCLGAIEACGRGLKKEATTLESGTSSLGWT